MSANTQMFSRRMLFWLVAIGVVSFLGSMALLAFGGGGSQGARVGGLPFARSALGHRAFVKSLQRLGIPVVVSRTGSVRKAGAGVLFVGEPRAKGWNAAKVRRLMRASHVILVLPKWKGKPDRRNPRWTASVTLLARSRVEKILRLVDPRARLVRPGKSVFWSASRYAGGPTILQPQLIRSPALRPIITSDSGLLVGQLANARSTIWIVSEPDIFANHGIGKGENAKIAIGLIRTLRATGGPLVIDTTIHGAAGRPSLWGSLLEVPFVVASLAGILALAFVLWSGMARFGAPLPAAPLFEAGKLTLIDNATRLLRYGGHQREILDRYRRALVSAVTARLHAPVHGPTGSDELVRWFDRVGQARGTRRRFSEIIGEIETLAAAGSVSDRKLLSAATRLYRWKGEMLDASERNQGR